MPLAAGTRLGTYEMVAPLGAGGMGEVDRAKDLRLGRDIALKVLPSGMFASAERLARFEREARTVAGLNRPNIVTLFWVEDAGATRFLTMELVEGRSLDHHLDPGGLPIARVHHGMEEDAKARAALGELIARHADRCADQVAEIFAILGDADAAFHWLERAYAQRDGGIVDMKMNPRLRSLHGDPRWGPFLAKVGLAD
jgi:hypothetical protein